MNCEKLKKFSSSVKGIAKQFKKSCFNSPKFECSIKDINLIEFLHKNKRTMGEIAEETNLTPGSVTTLISHFIDKGLVEREYDKNDRRKIYIVLTKQGNNIGDALDENHKEVTEKILNTLSDDEQDKLIELMGKVNSKLK